MLIEYFHKTSIDIDQIKYEQNLGLNNLNFFDLIMIGKSYYLNGEAFQEVSSLEELKHQKPFLAQITDSQGILHFVVVSQITNTKVIINDPSQNKASSLFWNEFKKIFTGNIIIFTANSKLYKTSRSFWKTLNFKNYALFILTYSIITFVTTIVFIAESQFIKKYGQDISNDYPNLYLYGYFLGLFLLNLGFRELNNFVLEKLKSKQQLIMLKKFLHFCIDYNNQIDYYKIFEESKFIIEFLTNVVIPMIPTTIANILCLVIIARINFGVASLIFIHNLIVIGITIVVKTPLQMPVTNLEVIKYLTNKEIYQNSGKETQVIEKILEQQQTNTQSFSNSQLLKTLELILDKVLIFLIYWFLWFDLKNQVASFESLIMILILNNLNQGNLKIILAFVRQRKKYLSYTIKINKLFNKPKPTGDCATIKNIKIVEFEKQPLIFKPGVNVVKKELGFLKVINKASKNSFLEVFINDERHLNLNSLAIRQQVYYANSQHLDIWYGTLLSNLVDNNLKNNTAAILKESCFLDFLDNYNLKLQSLINPEIITEFQKEVIILLRCLFTSKAVYIIDQNFQLIKQQDCLKLLQLATKFSPNLLIVFNDLY